VTIAALRPGRMFGVLGAGYAGRVRSCTLGLLWACSFWGRVWGGVGGAGSLVETRFSEHDYLRILEKVMVILVGTAFRLVRPGLRKSAVASLLGGGGVFVAAGMYASALS